MKTLITIGAGLVSLSIAGVVPASAFHLSPPGDFVGNGNTSATKNGVTLPCVAHFTGNVDSNGVGHVTGGTFKDVQGGTGCTLVTLSNLPWEVDATGAKTVLLHDVKFSTPIGSCGPGDLSGKVKDGKLIITAAAMPPDCTVSAKVKTKPTVSIVR